MIKKTKYLAKEALLRAKYIMVKDCIFCKIAAGEIKAKIVLESANVLAFWDVNPVSEVHILIVPKAHIASVATLENKDSKVLVEMFKMAAKIAKGEKLDAYRLAFNAGKFQHVPHLHMHLLAGKKIDWMKL